LGKGRYGAVRAFESLRTKEQVAIKTVDTSLFRHRELQQHIYETTALRLVSHPNLLCLREVVFDSDKCHMVTDYYAGNDLYDFLKRRGY
jgi:serine/threonine protein kinase